MFIELNMMIIFFNFRRPIIIGWGRDTGTILWPIQNLMWICRWRLDRLVDLIKIGFTGSPTLRPTTCGRPVVFQLLRAPNQYWAPNLRSSWPCSTEKYDHLSVEYTQLKTTHAQQRAEYAQQKMDHKQLRKMIMNMASQSGTCAPNPFWSYNHQRPPPPPPAPPLY